MPAPDFYASRRQLRRSRVQDALGLPRDGVNVELHRNRLLEQLANAADNPVHEFDALPNTTVDTVVSLALTEIEEKATETLVVVLLCVGVLAADGQFARLSLLADRLHSLSHRVALERPYLATSAEAFALSLQSKERSAELLLQERLGITNGANRQAVRPNRENLDDMLMAVTLRNLLTSDDEIFARRAIEAALTVNDSLLFTYVEAVLNWYEAANSARPSTVLAETDQTFAEPTLRRYLARRRIGVLYPSQIMAIHGGATLDQDHVLSLPTSSGKTLIAEFRVAAALTRHPGSRAIYVAPYRMLARQVERSFQNALGPLGITVRDLGSGFDPSFIPEGNVLPDVAICTPERLDALLRLSSVDSTAGARAADLFTSSNVIVFDELQLVGRPGRGPRFELIIARLRAKYPNMLFLGLSAMSQGADELAQWLTDANAIAGASRPTGTLEIVWETGGKLKQRAEPRPTTVAELPRSKAVEDAAALIVMLNARYRPVLAVEVSRPLAESLARRIVQLSPSIASEWRDSLVPSQLNRLNASIEEIRSLLGEDHPLARYMESGVAFHHAGVPTHVLQQIERLSEERLLRVVCATTTVAEGADLPFRVVVIPHLNFPGPSRRLERDLYLNIIGRAGRANVSVEGMVFILDSDAATLSNVVRASLWSNTTADRIRGRLGEVNATLRSVEDWTSYYEVQSQVMGWLGDGNSYVDDQAQALAESTLSWQQGFRRERASITALFTDALEDLEARGYALAASPYQLTARGRNARLTGLSAPTIDRLEHAIERSRNGWLPDLVGITQLSPDLAAQIARLVFEGLEVIQESLWLRRTAKNEQERFEALAALAGDHVDAFYNSYEYEKDIELLSAWILGSSYADLAVIAPVYERPNSLFGGRDESKRTSDATEYIGKLTYPASWVWSGARILAGNLGESFPSFIRNSIEWGLPSEASTQLVAHAAITRPGAIAITRVTAPDWRSTLAWVTDATEEELVALGLTALDVGRIIAFKERQ